MSIRNIAAENAIRKMVDSLHGYQCVSVKAQADYYLVAFNHENTTKTARVTDAKDLLVQLLCHCEPKCEYAEVSGVGKGPSCCI